MGGHPEILRLAPDLSFRFHAAAGASAWLDELARVMRLDGHRAARRTTGGPAHSTDASTQTAIGAGGADERIVFVRQADFRSMVDGARRGGHERCVRRRGEVSFVADPARRVTVCDLGPEQSPDAEYWKMGHALQPLYAAAHDCGGLLIHAALIERHGIGCLVCAPGGNGKSTICRRLPSGWNPLADDNALVLPRADGFAAHPLPTWSTLAAGDRTSVWSSAHAAPLSALFFLEQSALDETAPLGRADVALLLCDSVGWFYAQGFDDETERERQDRNARIFETACRIARCIPGFVLRASLGGAFWQPFDRALAELRALSASAG